MVSGVFAAFNAGDGFRLVIESASGCQTLLHCVTQELLLMNNNLQLIV
jgi:hypothetical protein